MKITNQLQSLNSIELNEIYTRFNAALEELKEKKKFTSSMSSFIKDLKTLTDIHFSNNEMEIEVPNLEEISNNCLDTQKQNLTFLNDTILLYEGIIMKLTPLIEIIKQ